LELVQPIDQQGLGATPNWNEMLAAVGLTEDRPDLRMLVEKVAK